MLGFYRPSCHQLLWCSRFSLKRLALLLEPPRCMCWPAYPTRWGISMAGCHQSPGCPMPLQAALPKYQALFKQYVSLAASQRRDVDLSLALEPQRLLGPGPSVLPPSRGMLGPGGATSSLAAAAPGPRDTPARSHKSHHHQQQQPALPLAPLPRQGLSSAAAAAAAGSGSAAGAARVRTSVVGAGEVVKAEDGSEVPQQVSQPRSRHII